jgi:hypothetical protein
MIKLTDIPQIMRANNWNVGADLMEHWFSLPSAIAPPYKNREDTIVTMKWALGFKRAKDVFDKLMRERIWTNDAGKSEIRNMLSRSNLLLSPGAQFGIYQSTQPIIHANAINFRSVSQDPSDDLDDLAAGLANFNFHVQIGGQVAAAPDGVKTTVTIMFVGVYIRDQFDFNGDQSLGYWNAETNIVSSGNPLRGDLVTNRDFCTWRAVTKKGGDFEIFSDVHILPLAVPEVIEV